MRGLNRSQPEQVARAEDRWAFRAGVVKDDGTEIPETSKQRGRKDLSESLETFSCVHTDLKLGRGRIPEIGVRVSLLEEGAFFLGDVDASVDVAKEKFITCSAMVNFNLKRNSSQMILTKIDSLSDPLMILHKGEDI